jgi:hypothetical protein
VTYDLGDAVVLSFTATDTAGNPANAAACTLTITLPDGTTDGSHTVAGTAGVYSYAFQTTQSGRHTYAWVATGTPGPGVGVGAYRDVLHVLLASPAALMSLADTKDLLRVPAGDSKFDGQLRFFLEGVTAVIDHYCGPMVPRQITERHTTAGEPTLMLHNPPVLQPAGQPHPLVSITPVYSYGVPYPDLSQFSVDFKAGEVTHIQGLPFYYGKYDVTYWAGRTYIGAHVLLAAEVILKHWWALERNNGRFTGYTPSAADDTTMMFGFAIPNRAVQMLEPDRAQAGIA